MAGRRNGFADDGRRRSGRHGEVGRRRPEEGHELLGGVQVGGVRDRSAPDDSAVVVGSRVRRREDGVARGDRALFTVVRSTRNRSVGVSPDGSPSPAAVVAVVAGGTAARAPPARGTGGSVRRPAACIVSMVPTSLARLRAAWRPRRVGWDS
jgi:hypothetical protein